MSLRTRIVLYLVVVHVAMATALAWVVGAPSVWLLAIEGATLVSLVVGLLLASRVFRTAEIGDEAARLLRDGDFTTRLRHVDEPVVDRLVDVYNGMVDRLRAERARIEEQHRFLEQVINASPSGVVILDFDGHVAEVNPAALALLGLERSDAVGRRVNALPTPLAGPLARLEPGEAEVVGLSGARRLRCHRGSFVDRGFPRTFYGIEELTDEARRFERAAYEKLIRVMSHEVANSVTAANSLLESSLTYAAQLPDESRTDLESALRIAIDRSAALNAFMRRFADVFRLPAPVRTQVDLRALLDRLVTLTRAQASDISVRRTWSDDAGPLLVSIDSGQFEQAVLNLLKNAVEAAGEGGVVEVSVDGSPSGITVVITDSGPGPGAEAEVHLFTPFFSTKPQGQGIGLTLAGEILTAHGFDYTLERGPEGPTRFVIRLGRTSDGEAPGAPPDAART